MKKLISLFTLVALLIATLAIFASCGTSTSKEIVYGSDDKISWSYDPTSKILTVKGDDAAPTEMNPYTKGGETPSPWYQYRTTASTLIISGVSKISANAFYSMYALTDIKFLDSKLVEIGDCAFTFCSSLATLTLPNSVTTIGVSAFESCSKLKEVKIPANVTSIGERAFAINNSLTAVSMSESCKTAVEADLEKIFFGITVPTITTYAVDENGAEVQPPVESDTASESDTTVDTTADTSDETTAPAETDAEEQEPQNNVTTVIAIVIFVLVIIGIVIGMILIMRSNDKQTKDSQTVRKNDTKNDNKSNNKNSKGNKNSKYNKNGKSKGKKK